MKHLLVGEHPTHFEIQHEDGTRFHVAKRDLSPNVIKKIRAIPFVKPEVQHFDGGGVVAPADPDKAKAVSDTFRPTATDKAIANAINHPIDTVRNAIGFSDGGPVLPTDFITNSSSTPAPDTTGISNQSISPLFPTNDSAPSASAQGTDTTQLPPRQPLLQLDPSTGKVVGVTPAPGSTSYSSADSSPMVSKDQQVSLVPHAPTSAATPTLDPFGMETKGLNMQMAGAKTSADAQSKAADDTAKAYGDYQNQLKTANDTYSQSMQDWNDQHDKLVSDIQNYKINPNRLWQNASTGNKIGASIALILGGVGGALTNSPNAAAQEIDKLTQQDIDAQQSELGKKNNLLSENFRKYGTIQDARNATALQLNAALTAQVQMAASKAKSGEAQGTLQMLQGQLTGQKGQLQQQLAQSQALKQLANGGTQGAGANLEMLPEKVRERAVQLPNGQLRLALTPDGAKEVRTVVQTTQPIFNSLDKLAALGPKAMIPGTAESQQADAIRAQLIPLVNENAGLKRLSGEDIGNINKMFTDPTQFKTLLSGSTKTNAFKQFLQDKLMSTMNNQLEGGMPAYSIQSREKPPVLK